MESWSLDCRPQGLVGAEIGISGLDLRRGEVLVFATLGDGSSARAVLRAGAASWIVPPPAGKPAVVLDYLRLDAGAKCSVARLLNFILLDSKRGRYPSSLSVDAIQKLGIQVIDTRLVSKQSAPYYDARLLVSALLSLT